MICVAMLAGTAHANLATAPPSRTTMRTFGAGLQVGALALRASPAIVRLARGAVEAGLHLQLAAAGSEVTLHALFGVDWYVR